MNAPCVVSPGPTSGMRRDQPVRYIHSHAALRGVAALLVVTYHLQLGAPYRLSIETATPFFERGYLMVDLFFILSGFVISLTSDADRRRPFSRAETWQFYVARVARLYPLHLFCLGFIVASTAALAQLQHWHHPNLRGFAMDAGAARSLAAELLLVQAWIPGAPRWNIPSWSISAEVASYMLFPALLVLRSRLPRATACVMALVPIAFYLWVLHRDGSLDIIAGLAPLRCLSGFMIGMILYDLRHSASRWPDPIVAGAQLAAVAAILAMLAVRLPDPAIVPFFALLVIATWQDRGPIPMLLRHRLLARAGELSYSIYLTHVCLIGMVVPIWYWMMAHIGLAVAPARIVLIGVCFAVILLASAWTHRHVEQPGRKLVRRMLSRSGGKAERGA